MSWNIFKRIAQLEQQVKDLTDFSGDKSRWLGQLEEKIKHIENKLFIEMAISKAGLAPDPRMPVFTKAEVDQEKEKKRLYQREWYAKNKAAVFERRKAAKKLKEAQNQGNSKKTYYWKNREKMREYARQYQLKKRAKLQGET